MDRSPDIPTSLNARRPFSRWLAHTNNVSQVFLSAAQVPGLINLAGGLPAPESYPVEALADIAANAVRDFPIETLGYGAVEGLAALRDCLAERLSTPSLNLSRDNILITSSGMQALELVGKVLLDSGATISTQFPTYLGALDAWRPREPVYRNMRLEDPLFDAQQALDGAQFAYAVPNFSNPTGRLVDLATRAALVEAAYRTGTWLVEDDPYGALHYDGERLPSMLELSAERFPQKTYDGPVIYMGTISKLIAPGLRVGWIVASPEMIRALTMAKQSTDLCTSGLTQRIALRAIADGLVDELQPVVVDLYRRRRDTLCEALHTYASPYLEWERPVGGMFVWARVINPEINTDSLLTACLAHGVCVSPSSVFDALGQDTRHLRMNFTLNGPEQLQEGVKRLAAAIASLTA